MLLRYPGGKSKQTEKIKRYFPASYLEYREPFVGGGGVFWTIPKNRKRWVNDLNRSLIAVYEALKSRPREFIAMCDQIPPLSLEEAQLAQQTGCHPPRLSALFEQFKTDDEVDLPLRYLFLNRLGWNGRVMLDWPRRRRAFFSNPRGWNSNLRNKLADAADIVAGTHITCSDFEDLFDEPGDNVFLFSDPPYMKDTELPKNSKLYEFGFTVEDHRRLRDCVSRCQHQVMLTYDDHSHVRELYKDFYIHEESWIYRGRADRKMGRELIITNYPVPRPPQLAPNIFEDADLQPDSQCLGTTGLPLNAQEAA